MAEPYGQLPASPTSPSTEVAEGGEKNPVKPPEPTEAEKELVKDFKRKIEAAEALNKDRFKQYETNRKNISGRQVGATADEMTKCVRTNLIYSTIATIIPQTYAKNPDISVTPTEAVDDRQYDLFKKFSKTLEIVLHKIMVVDAKLKKRAKSALRAAMTCEIGWVKMVFQENIKTDPIIQERMNDIQDNIARIDALTKELTNPDEGGEQELEKAQLIEAMAGLREQVEVAVTEGIVMDKLLTEHILVLDPTIADFDDYVHSTDIAQIVWMDEEAYETNFGYCPSDKATCFYRMRDTGDAKDTTAGTNAVKFYKVYEIWSLNATRVYTWCKGEEGFCRPPYTPRKIGRRFYPYFALGFNLLDGEFYPLSDVELIAELNKEYNNTRDAFAEHRSASLPVIIARSGGQLTPDDIQKIQKRKANEIVVITGTGGDKIENDLAHFPNAAIDPMAYDTTPIRSDIELVLGATDAVRGNILKAKTATEAEIMREGMQSRNADRQDTIEEWIGEMACYAAEGLMQRLTVPQVTRLAGPKAVWPQMSMQDVFELVSIEIRAGSTGKPNKIRERDQWLQLMPVIQDGMGKVMELRMQGQNDMADAVVELIRETLSRFDERIDVDAFIPPKPQDGTDPNQGAQATQQLAQLQPQLQQLQAENEQLKSGAQVEANKAQMQQDTAVQTEKIKQDAERERALIEGAVKIITADIAARATATVPEQEPPLSNEQVLGLIQNMMQVLGGSLSTAHQTISDSHKTLAEAVGGLTKAQMADRVPIRNKQTGVVERLRMEQPIQH